MQSTFGLTFPWGRICSLVLAYSGRGIGITRPNSHLANEHPPQSWISFGHQTFLFLSALMGKLNSVEAAEALGASGFPKTGKFTVWLHLLEMHLQEGR